MKEEALAAGVTNARLRDSIEADRKKLIFFQFGFSTRNAKD